MENPLLESVRKTQCERPGSSCPAPPDVLTSCVSPTPSPLWTPRGVTPHHLTPDVWAQIGGKWVLFGTGGRETVSPYMGVV